MTTSECFGCGKSVSGGLQILDQYLCPDCEGKITRTKVSQEDYQDWIEIWKRFWDKSGIVLKNSDE